MFFASDNGLGASDKVMQAIAAANGGARLGYGNDDATKAVVQRLCDLFEREVGVYMVAPARPRTASHTLHHDAALGHRPLPRREPRHRGRVLRAGILHRRRQAGRHTRSRRQDHRRGALREHRRPRPPGTAQRADPRALDHPVDRARPGLFRRRGEALSAIARANASASTWTVRASPMPSRRSAARRPRSPGRRASMCCPSAPPRAAASPARPDLLRPGQGRRDGPPPHARRPSPLQAPLPRSPDGGLPRRRTWLDLAPARQCRRAAPGKGSLRHSQACAFRSCRRRTASSRSCGRRS